VFRVTPTGNLTTLYRFGGDETPNGPLVQASDGSLYGMTFDTIFKITLAGEFTTLHGFCSHPNCDGGPWPWGGLIQGTDGNFYGVTQMGGVNCELFGKEGCGTVFRITAGGTLTTLHRFDQFDLTDGAYPLGGLLQATDGVFYGTTYYGGSSANPLCYPVFIGCGTVFSLDMGLGPFVSFVYGAGKVGQTGGILGQGFTGTTNVSLNEVSASFTVVSDTFLKATVPAGATTGYVTVTTPTGTLTSNVPFHVIE
jgi:uncharacterized repeat protein (TIGR03803 family)